jgi:MFS family permease
LEPSSYDDSNKHENESRNDKRFAATRTPTAPYTTNPVKISAYAWKVVIILSCIATMIMYAETMLIPAIPDLIEDFHVSYSMSSWILTAYLVSGAVMTPIAGKLSDIYGRKKMLLIIMIVYAIGVSLSVFASNISFLLIARAIQGVGMSMFPIAFSIVRDQFPREKMSIGQGIITSMFASGAIVGLTVGGIIVQNYGWRTTFITIIPIAIALLLIIRVFINLNDKKDGGEKLIGHEETNQGLSKLKSHYGRKERLKPKHAALRSSNQIDIKGAIALAVTIISFLLVLTFLETSGSSVGTTTGNYSTTRNQNSAPSDVSYSSIQELPFLILGIVSLGMFIVIEKRSKFPLVDFKLMLNRAILPANLIIVLVGFSMFMVFQTIPILVRNPEPVGFGEDAISTGKVQLPFAIILLIFGPTSGFIVSKLGSLKPIILGTIITTASFIGLLTFHSTELLVSVNLAILSTGLSLTSVGAMNVIILATPRQFSGISLGMTTLLRIIGSSIGPALAGMYMQTHQTLINVNDTLRYFPSSSSFNMIFLTAVIVSIISVGLAIVLRRKVMKMTIPNLM